MQREVETRERDESGTKGIEETMSLRSLLLTVVIVAGLSTGRASAQGLQVWGAYGGFYSPYGVVAPGAAAYGYAPYGYGAYDPYYRPYSFGVYQPYGSFPVYGPFPSFAPPPQTVNGLGPLMGGIRSATRRRAGW